MSRTRNRSNKKGTPSSAKDRVGKYPNDGPAVSSNGKSRSASTKASKDAEPSVSSSDDGSHSGESSGKAPEGENLPRTGSVANDPEWYSKDVPMVIDSASLPYSEPLGSKMPLQTSGEVYNTNGTTATVRAANNPIHSAIPGVCTLFTKSSFGNNRYAQDPANVAANALYTHVRYVNSGRKNYDPADLFMYISSMADIYSFAMWAQRTYAKSFIYSQRNLYVGKGLLLAENIDADNIKVNLANFRYWLNTYVNKIASWAVPADLSYYSRRAWIYSHIYLENAEANIKDQLYQFSPDGFYRFELDSAGAGCLKYYTIDEIVGHTNQLTVTDFMTIGDFLLENITGDEDFGLMSGDVIKAFEGRIIGISAIPEVVDLIPVYSEYVLLQMKNASIIAYAGRGSKHQAKYDKLSNNVECYLGNVYQTPDGNIYSIEGINANTSVSQGWSGVAIGMNKVLTLNTPQPTPIDNMEISRLTVGGYGVLALTGMDPVIKMSVGADFVTDARITKFAYNASNVWTFTRTDIGSHAWDKTTLSTIFDMVFDHIRFEYAPMLYEYETSGSNPIVIDNLRNISNVANFTIVDWRIIARMHEVALLSMLWVPGVAKVINF